MKSVHSKSDSEEAVWRFWSTLPEDNRIEVVALNTGFSVGSHISAG